MILDISSYNGAIAWNKVIKLNQIDRVILRGTTKNGNLDTKTAENYRALKSLKIPVDVYKFSYATSAQSGFDECVNLLKKLASANVKFTELWLDIENIDGVSWTKQRAFNVICGYMAALGVMGQNIDFGIYCNVDYLNRVIPNEFKLNLDLWVARWTNWGLGLNQPNIKLWQYTSKGEIDGISGNVDISREV